jgi:ABC-2 type transport system permease protein
MRFWGIFRFELAYQLRRPWPWLIFAALGVLSYLMTRDGTLAEALQDDFFINSPFAVAKTTVVGGLVWLLVGAVVAGDAAARDVETRMHPLTYTTPVSKAEHLGGRFLAALLLNALLLLAVQAGILLAVYSPGVDPELIGPFRSAAYLTAYAFIALPNAFFASAIQFALATRSGRPMASYLGSLLLFFTGFFVAGLLLFKRTAGALLDPIGVRFILDDLSHDWTTAEKSGRLIELSGTILQNRLVWLGIAVAALAVTYLRFRFAHRAERSGWRRWMRRRNAHPPTPAGIGLEAVAPVRVPQVARTFGFAMHARKTLAIAWASFRTITTSRAGLAMLAGIPLLTILVVLDQMSASGMQLVPTTSKVIEELTAPLSAEMNRWVIVPLLIVFFAGELIWRERDAGLGEIVDAMPGSEWAPFLGKFLGLALLLGLLMAALTAAGMLAQVILGFRDFELGLYFRSMFGLQLPEYLLFAMLALVAHLLADQKYIGHLAAISAFVIIVLAPTFGIEHDLLTYGAGPAWSYTELRGFGPSLGPWAWFKLYWAAWALLLAVVARLLWVRGRERSLGVRLQLARARFTRPTAWTAATAVALILTVGGFVFYNTNVLNEYRTASDIVERGAEYERRYRRYAEMPQPRLTAATLRVEIDPDRRAVDARGTYRLVNRSAVAIDSIHVALEPDVETGEVKFDRPAAITLDDEELGHRIYALARPLQPGDSMTLDFQVHREPQGFRESGADAAVAANGTFFMSDWFPAIGYQGSREITSASDRRDQGLAPRPLIPSLDDADARQDPSAGVAFEAVVGTREDQVAVAPGALRRTWTEHGRRYFHYSTSGPIGSEWPFFSARYAVHEARWNDVAIRIFHNPKHTAHLDRVVRSIGASMDYYTRHFGPYRYSHLSVVERPPNGTGMHADASVISHGEGFPLLNPKSGKRSLDLPFAVVAHEMGHQWAVPYAFVEGAPVMSESLAWYYGMKAVEHAKGREQLRRLLSFMRQPYPHKPIRRGEPLLRGLDPYMAYRRGPFALFALSEYMGEERVNTALRRLLEQHLPEGAPLATTLDLYRELQAVTPDSLRPMLHDLFEVNTFWDLETDRVTAVETEAGTFQVTLDVRARKVVADSAGEETEVPMDAWVQIGVVGPVEQGAGELSEPLYLRMHRVRSGRQTITVTVPREPIMAGIDPYHVLDWVEDEDDDNIEEVRVRR